TRFDRSESCSEKTSSPEALAKEDADLDCRECSEDPPRNTRPLEWLCLLYRACRRSYWRIVGAAVEGHRLDCEDDHFWKGFLERPIAGDHKDWPATCPAYAGRSGTSFVEPPSENQKHRPGRFCLLPVG